MSAQARRQKADLPLAIADRYLFILSKQIEGRSEEHPDLVPQPTSPFFPHGFLANDSRSHAAPCHVWTKRGSFRSLSLQGREDALREPQS
jgi:hypothetical protein